ncbi:MAG: SUMF1/EgtB/PvdO family nonheme iron enzyme [Anaerolineales bacterium]|nr:SUMF1/EgtB/PvdO family nonheme iron enzyme [Anaerolineales bacterium]
MPLATGQILNNRYRIVKLLGQGGFGAVYQAWDTNLDEPVAIKESIETSPAAQKQFQIEAKLLFNLRHANLPRVHDFFIIPGTGMYLAMDFIEGEDLEIILQKAGGYLTEAQVLPWILQVCDALIYLHGQNPAIIHRDIKPANIKITPQGQAVLVDFGLAKAYHPGSRTTMGARAVTPGFSPLEQYSGSGRTDFRTDIYALGATLYTLFTGKEPPEAPDRNLGAGLTAPRQLNQTVSPVVEQAILTALAMLPEARHQSVQDFRRMLEIALYDQRTGNVGWKNSTAHTAPASSPAVPLSAAALPQGQTYTFNQPVISWGGILLAMLVGGILIVLIYMSTDEDIRVKSTPTPYYDTSLALPAPSLTATPTSTPIPTKLPNTYTDAQGVRMALIPAGDFRMGSEDGGDGEKPVHTVYLDAFYMDIYEVTIAFYGKCVQAGICTLPSDSSSSTQLNYYGIPRYANSPVIYVSWDQARVFCEWRRARLPTEAEWEKAARGGLDGYKYPWGNDFPSCLKVNYLECVNDTSPVGSCPANGFGLFDMVGNVSEWVWDWYSETYYNSSPRDNPTGPTSGYYKVTRGGSWRSRAHDIQIAERGGSYYGADNNTGFRCAQSP